MSVHGFCAHGSGEGAGPSARLMRVAAPRDDCAIGAAIAALKAHYPIVARIVGLERFSELAAGFAAEISAEVSPLASWARRLPEWIARQNVGRILPHLANVAQIDRLWGEAQGADDERPFARDAIAAMTASQWSRSRLWPHPAARFGWFATPAPSVWLAHFDPASAEDRLEWKAEGILITRPDGALQARRIGPAVHRILSGLRIGETIGGASSAAHALYPEADITGAVDAIVDSGALAALRPR